MTKVSIKKAMNAHSHKLKNITFFIQNCRLDFEPRERGAKRFSIYANIKYFKRNYPQSYLKFWI